MKKLKVIKVDSESIVFENDIKLYSEHESDCCESHYLSFDDLTLSDLELCLIGADIDKRFDISDCQDIQE